MSRRLLVFVAVASILASAACSRSTPAAEEDKGLLVSAGGSATVTWKPVVVLMASGRGATRDAAVADLQSVVARVTQAAKQAAPNATVTVDQPGGFSSDGPEGTILQKIVVNAGTADAAERTLRAVLAIEAPQPCCTWRLVLRPDLGTSVLQQARKDAITSARKEADDLAAAAGVEAGKVIAIHEGPSTPVGSLNLSVRSFTERGLQLMLEDLKARPTTSTHELLSLEVRFEIA